MTTLYLFPDTNLFIQCLSLVELDWSLWPEYSEVHLIVGRPVQAEIDKQKNRGNDRVGRRARKTHGMFGEIITTEPGYRVIREADPVVKLFLDGARKPSEELSEVLDYGVPDDRLLGHMHAYANQHPEREVRLLTHDSGPMMTAKSLNLPFTPIPDSWLREPEESEAEKENRRLRDNIRRLEAGPEFEVTFVSGTGEAINEIRSTQRVPTPLTKADLDGLVGALKGRLPSSSSFVPLRFDTYRDWLEKCENTLANLHEELQRAAGGVPFAVKAANTGTSPARDALVTLTTNGDALLLPLRQLDEEAESIYTDLRQKKLTLPPIPKPVDVLSVSSLDFRPRDLLSNMPQPNYPREPNTFYYAPEFPHDPAHSFSLECKQWRHLAGDTYFEAEVLVGHGSEEVQGEVECTIHAENLSNPVRASIPLRVAVEQLSTLAVARSLVESVEQRP